MTTSIMRRVIAVKWKQGARYVMLECGHEHVTPLKPIFGGREELQDDEDAGKDPQQATDSKDIARKEDVPFYGYRLPGMLEVGDRLECSPCERAKPPYRPKIEPPECSSCGRHSWEYFSTEWSRRSGEEPRITWSVEHRWRCRFCRHKTVTKGSWSLEGINDQLGEPRETPDTCPRCSSVRWDAVEISYYHGRSKESGAYDGWHCNRMWQCNECSYERGQHEHLSEEPIPRWVIPIIAREYGVTIPRGGRPKRMAGRKKSNERAERASLVGRLTCLLKRARPAGVMPHVSTG